MERKSTKPYLIILGLVAIAIVLLLIIGDTRFLSESPVRTSLPETVGEYTGENILFCQNTQCLKSFLASAVSDDNKCPSCGSITDLWGPGEKAMLPADTILFRKRYRNASGREILTSVVLTGKERTSIHRPQLCLTGQGRNIVSEQTIEVPLEDNKDLSVRFLDLTHSTRLQSFAYWFKSTKHETSSHMERTFLTAAENILNGTSHRWAYISITTDRKDNSDSHIKIISDFIKDLYPLVTEDSAIKAKQDQ